MKLAVGFSSWGRSIIAMRQAGLICLQFLRVDNRGNSQVEIRWCCRSSFLSVDELTREIDFESVEGPSRLEKLSLIGSRVGPSHVNLNCCQN